MTGLQASAAIERRGIVMSAATAGALAALGIGWGLFSGSQIILLDGAYALIGLGLSWLALRAGRLIAAGPTERYPFGRETLGPLVVGIQGLVLLGSLGYASLEAVQSIIAGPEPVAAGLGLAYGLATLAASLLIVIVLVRLRADSDLVTAEVHQWRAGAALSAAMTVGFLGALLLIAVEQDALAGYVDPVLVLVAAFMLAPTPVRMMRSAWTELLEGAPGPEVTDPVGAAVEEMRARHGLPEPTMRVGKLGRKIYVELDFVVREEDAWSISDADRFRRELMDTLRRPGQVLWLNVELHTDPRWDD